MEPSLLDTDTLSEVMKGVDQHVQANARRYLTTFGHFTFSLITRYEILRGLKARRATRQADILIAATALEHNLVMVTENVNHFHRIPGLSVESWRA